MSDTIRLRGIVAEDFSNYFKPSLFLISSYCDFKCCHEGGFSESICQNSSLIRDTKIQEYNYESIFNLYKNNPITKAIVIGGMECFKQFDEVKGLIQYFRWNNCFDEFILYTGYYPEEIIDELNCLQKFDNIIVKFGRYKPGDTEHFDNTLGINLVSNNQWAEKIS